MPSLLNFLRSRRRRLEVDLQRELQYHVDRRVEALMAAGASAADARRQALIELGGVLQVEEHVRDAWTWRWLDAFARDTRFALRALRKHWGFALGAGAILTLAIGANTAIFSVVHAVVLRPLDYPDADRLVSIQTMWTNTGRMSREVAGPDFLDWQLTGLFEALGHSDGEDDLAISVDGRPEFANFRSVSGRFFEVFGRPPAAGRLFTPEDDVPGAPPIAVVGDSWAISHFGSPEAAVGNSIDLFGARLTIVGVAAPGFRHPNATAIWTPNGGTNPTNRGAHVYQAIGRLAPGVTLDSARARMDALGDRLAREFPENRFKRFALIPLQEQVTGRVHATLWMLMGAAALVLLIACANISNLLLTRSTARGREIAVRTALGASRARVLRQLLTESVVLVALSGIAGVALAAGLLQALIALAPPNLPRLDEIRMDGSVLWFTVVLSALASVACGILPAVQGSRLDLIQALNQGGSRGIAGGGGMSRAALVAAEVALSVMLLAGAALLLRSFHTLNHVDLGFTTEHVVVVQTQVVPSGPDGRRRRAFFYQEFLERLRAQPGVAAAAGVAVLPLGRETTSGTEYMVEGQPEGRVGERIRGEIRSISPGYFGTLQIPLIRGRDFRSSDDPDRPRVAIVNETLARQAWPGESPIGRRIRTPNSEWLEVVGVVGDTRWLDPSRPAPPELYTASLQGGGSLTILVRAATDEAAVAGTVRTLMTEMNPTVPLRVATMDELFGEALAHARFRTLLVVVFGATAALLAAVGIFSVLAYLVGQRSRELAVRRAVGASSSDVVRLIAGCGAKPIAAGLAAGLIGALAAARSLETLLFQVSPWDAASYLGAVAVLVGVAAVATLLPAWRAVRIEPVVALRLE